MILHFGPDLIGSAIRNVGGTPEGLARCLDVRGLAGEPDVEIVLAAAAQRVASVAEELEHSCGRGELLAAAVRGVGWDVVGVAAVQPGEHVPAGEGVDQPPMVGIVEACDVLVDEPAKPSCRERLV